MAYLPTFNELIAMLQVGKMTADDVQKVTMLQSPSHCANFITQAVDICIDGSLRMKDLMRQCLAERHKQQQNNSVI